MNQGDIVLNVADTKKLLKANNTFKKYFSKQLTSTKDNDTLVLVADEARRRNELFFEN